MTPTDVSLVAVLMLGVFAFVALSYHEYRNAQLRQRKWADYQQRMTEIDQVLKRRAAREEVLKQHRESGEVAKQPRAEGDMSTREYQGNVAFLNAVNEEQQ